MSLVGLCVFNFKCLKKSLYNQEKVLCCCNRFPYIYQCSNKSWFQLMEWFIFSAGLFLPLLNSPSVTNVLFQTCWQRQDIMALILFMLEMRGGNIVLILAFYPSLSFSSLTFLLSCYRLTYAGTPAAMHCEFVYYSLNTMKGKVAS